MRVFSKKRMTFTNPETKEKASVEPLVFFNLPDWVNLDPLFGWAKKEGSLEVFGEDKPSGRGSRRNRSKNSEEPQETVEAVQQEEVLEESSEQEEIGP